MTPFVPSKSLFKSKTFWVNILGVVTLVISGQMGITIPAEYAVPIGAVVNILLRLLTDNPVHIVAGEPPPLPSDTTVITEAVRSAYAHTGLPLDEFQPDKSLVSSGKLYAVLHHAADALNTPHNLKTVGDLVTYLASLPPPKV